MRKELFAGSHPDSILHILGWVHLFLSPQLHFTFSVRADGSAVSGTSPLENRSLTVWTLDKDDRSGKAVVMTLEVASKTEGLKIFNDIVVAYERKLAPLRVRIATTSCRQEWMKPMLGHRRRTAIIHVSLDDGSSANVTALIQESSRVCESDGTTSYEWGFKAAPTVSFD